MEQKPVFLYSGKEGQYLEKIQGLIKKSKRIDIAVAFWGKGRLEKLMLDSRGKEKNVRILCSLKNGISNPDVIEQLINTFGKKNVKQYENLHAKVFLFDKEAVVGSANVSTFGLPSTELEEENGWMEAGILVDDSSTVEKIEEWYDKIWKDKNSKEIAKKDLDKARKERPLHRPPTLYDTLEKLPEFFDENNGINWRIAICQPGDISEKAKKVAKELCSQRCIKYDDDNLTVYDDWPTMQANMRVIGFHVKGKKVNYNYIWDILAGLDNIWIGKYCPDFQTETDKIAQKQWCDFIEFITQESDEWQEEKSLLLTIQEAQKKLKEYKQQKR